MEHSETTNVQEKYLGIPPHDSLEINIDPELQEFIRISNQRFLSDPDIRIIHVSKMINLPKKGEISSSAILLNDPSTGVFLRGISRDDPQRNYQWHSGFVFIPIEDNSVIRAFTADVRSERKKSRRDIRTRERNPQNGKYIRLDRGMLEAKERSQLIDCILETEDGYNELWIDITKVAPLPIKIRQKINKPVEIDYQNRTIK